jgi:hypothetical protein
LASILTSIFVLAARGIALKISDLLPHRTTSNNFKLVLLAEYVREDCIEVDELLLQLSDYKNDYADVAAAKL